MNSNMLDKSVKILERVALHSYSPDTYTLEEDWIEQGECVEELKDYLIDMLYDLAENAEDTIEKLERRI